MTMEIAVFTPNCAVFFRSNGAIWLPGLLVGVGDTKPPQLTELVGRDNSMQESRS